MLHSSGATTKQAHAERKEVCMTEHKPIVSAADVNMIFRHLRRHPAIPALKQATDIEIAADCGAKLVFFLTGTIRDLAEVCQRAQDNRIKVFCHIDLIQGIGKDPAGIEWLAAEIGASGILTTRSNLARAAKSAGLVAIQRLFLLDSESLKTGIEVVSSSRADAVEILPALVLPSLAHRLPVRELSPFIAGGLVETEAELEAVVSTGALGVSTSKKELWTFERALPG